MIFTVTTVLSAYALGVAVFTAVVRFYKTVGAGFYWMMYGTNLALVVLARISDQYSPVILDIVCVAAFLQLVVSIVMKNQMKDKVSPGEMILTIVSIFSILMYFSDRAQDGITGNHMLVEWLRLCIGGLLLGGVLTTMLVGHWYLVQPNLSKKLIARLCAICGGLLLCDVVLWFFSPSMISVFRGTISDHWNGTLGYMWAGSVVTTAVLLFAARKALNEKSYSAVMATTGLLYLAILMANGVELIPRAIFS